MSAADSNHYLENPVQKEKKDMICNIDILTLTYVYFFSLLFRLKRFIQKNSLFVTFQFVVNDLNDNDNVIDEWMDII